MFFPSGVSMLTEATMKEFAEAMRSTGKKQLVVFNEIDGRTKNVQGNNSAYRAMGDMAYGIVTKKGPMPTKPVNQKEIERLVKEKNISEEAAYKILASKNIDKVAMLTDGTLDDNKVMIDEMIKGLAGKQAEGYELLFDFRGYGQYMAGYNEYAENKEGKPDFDASAPETFNYLSQQLFENFGYLNPNYLKTLEGRRIVQSREPVTDDEIFDLKKSCKLA
jgi:NACalpha-BTF3-like transcription factor